MIMKIFSVHDAAVGGYMQPFFSPTTGSAIRSLTEAVNDPKHDFHKHSKDYSLWLLGDYDDTTGVISAGPPIHVLACMDLLNKA